MMKPLGINGSSVILKSQKRIPLNTIVLPPLSPTFSETEAQLLSQVLVNKTNTSTVNGELMNVNRSSEILSENRHQQQKKGPEGSRVAQLEQNIKFLQEQHQLMLTGLHKEIDSLRLRNRDLQFQLIFAKGSIPSSPSSSSEDDTKHKVFTSPSAANITPLQVEILERELGELKLHMHDIESENVYLSAIVDEQKKKLERYERDRERQLERASQPDPELLKKLDDTEALLRKLHHENSELRKESSAGSNSSAYHQHRDSYYHRISGQRTGTEQPKSNGRHRGNYKGNWFPPLHSQSYWQGGRGGMERSGGGNGGGEPSLPALQGNNGGSSGQYQGRRNTNNNHYRGNDNRKYRGGQNTSRTHNKTS